MNTLSASIIKQSIQPPAGILAGAALRPIVERRFAMAEWVTRHPQRYCFSAMLDGQDAKNLPAGGEENAVVALVPLLANRCTQAHADTI
jgi:hypothetical protein